MNLNLQYRIKSNPNYIRFLRENSLWYKYLNRSPNYFAQFENEMKVKYKLTSKDKLDRFSENIDRVSQLIDIFSWKYVFFL